MSGAYKRAVRWRWVSVNPTALAEPPPAPKPNPLAMDVSELEDVSAQRLVDFATGLTFGLQGSIAKARKHIFYLEHPDLDESTSATPRTRQDRALLPPGRRGASRHARPGNSAPYPRVAASRPRGRSDVEKLGQWYRDGLAVIIDLTDAEVSDAKRVVDFSAGLVFARRGGFDKVTTRVFLISPPGATAEDEADQENDSNLNGADEVAGENSPFLRLVVNN